MLTKKYMTSVKNLPAIMNKIVEGVAPDKFTTEHLKKLGFTSSNDRAVIGILKDLNFISENGSPTQRYHDYRNVSKSRQILGEALKDAYTEIFHINEKPSQADRQAITGLFKSTHNVSDVVANFMTYTFLSLLSMADISGSTRKPGQNKMDKETAKSEEEGYSMKKLSNEKQVSYSVPNLRYYIEIHLPGTKDIELYNAIFKSLKHHLLDE
jgi:hypothetical protein